MRILVISSTPTHPQDAGNRARIHALLAALKAAGHAVHFCLLLRENPSPAAISAMAAAWDELIAVPHDRAREGRSLGALHGIDDWILPEAEAAFAQLAARDPGFDLVLVEYVFLSRALEFFGPGVRKVIDTHDVFGGRAEALAALGLENRFFATTPAEEARGLDRADLVLAIQHEEARLLRGRTSAPVLTLGHLPDAVPRHQAGGLRIGYLGSVNPLNTRALGRFLDALGDDGAEVVLAGGAALPFAARPGLLSLGPVADPAEFYGAVDLVVNPHEGGTGLKIKTVEALAHGLPVIGTMEAFAGLPVRCWAQACRDAAEVAAAARRWRGDAAFRGALARASAETFAAYAAEVRAARAVMASTPALALAVDPPRLLLVTDIPFWRGVLGNHARIAALAGAAAAQFDLDLFFCGAMDPAEHEAARRAIGARGRIFTPLAAPPADLPKGLTPFERGQADPALLAALEAHLARHPAHAVMVQYVRLSYLRQARGMPALTILDTHDVMSLRAENFRHFDRAHFLEIGAPEELRILSAFAVILAIQPDEARWLDANLRGRVICAPHAVAARPRAWGSAGSTLRIGFLGGDSPMNRDGARWLLDQVWPAIAPLGAALHIAGGVCAGLPDRPGVTLHGEVPDHHAFLDTLDIAVNPVAYGGGLKIKTVEYLRHGLPSVLTAEALTGIVGGANEAYALATDRAAFVAALAALVSDAGLRARMGEAAFALGARLFGPETLDGPMRSLAALARAAPLGAPPTLG